MRRGAVGVSSFVPHGVLARLFGNGSDGAAKICAPHLGTNYVGVRTAVMVIWMMVVGGKTHQKCLPGDRSYYGGRRHPTQVPRTGTHGAVGVNFGPQPVLVPALRRGCDITESCFK